MRFLNLAQKVKRLKFHFLFKKKLKTRMFSKKESKIGCPTINADTLTLHADTSTLYMLVLVFNIIPADT